MRVNVQIVRVVFHYKRPFFAGLRFPFVKSMSPSSLFGEAGSAGCYLQLCRGLLLDALSAGDEDIKVLTFCHKHVLGGLQQQLVGERYQRWQSEHNPYQLATCFDPHRAQRFTVGIPGHFCTELTFRPLS